jgi:hypothetical protein
MRRRNSMALQIPGRVFPSERMLSLAKENIVLQGSPKPKEDCGRKGEPLRSLVPIDSEYDVPGITEDDAIVLLHDQSHKNVSGKDVPDENDTFSFVEERIDNELIRKRLRMKLVKNSRYSYSNEEELLERINGHVPSIASMRKFPMDKRKKFKVR